ncbi:MAG TPA: sigma-70 family RNA polymerase sigma factor [Anaerolineaceae bacterium]|nr:sigma-70 family RNA polymerase sigma factor [Anaerolineaceae bacterium]
MELVITCTQPMYSDREIALIRSTQAGNLNSFNELVLTYQDRVYNLAYSILGTHEAAEDATQEAFLSAYRKISIFKTGPFMAWMYRITVNACYDELRRVKRRQTLPLEPVDENMEEFDSPSWMVDPCEQPLESVERHELRKTIQESIHRLPVEYRVAIILIDVQEMGYSEAAQVLAIPIGTLKSRVARGRAILVNWLKRTRIQ